MDTPESRPPTPPKSTLFCPSCDHRARVDGDWQCARIGTKMQYRCPDCGSVVTTRPAGGHDPDAEAILVTYWETVTESTRLWQRFWERTTGAN